MLQIQPRTIDDLSFLRSIENTADFWNLPRSLGHNATVSVSPAKVEWFRQLISSHNISHSTLVSDLEEVIEKERHQQQTAARSISRSPHRSISFDAYPRSNQINLYLDQLAKDYPKLVTVIDHSVTHEYRKIKYIRISNANGTRSNKTIFVDAGIHAREWIAPSTALYLIHELVENADRNKDLLDRFDWVIMPLANPDGYEYTHSTVSIYCILS